MLYSYDQTEQTSIWWYCSSLWPNCLQKKTYKFYVWTHDRSKCLLIIDIFWPHYPVQIVSLKCYWLIVSIHYRIGVVHIWCLCICFVAHFNYIMYSSTWCGLWMWWFDILITHDLYTCFCAHVSEIWHSKVKLAYKFLPSCFVEESTLSRYFTAVTFVRLIYYEKCQQHIL